MTGGSTPRNSNPDVCVIFIKLDNKAKFLGVMRFHVLMAASIKMVVFWVVAPCSLAEVY
jgi:hypothetical protein